MRCNFQTDYFDPLTQKQKTFECNEEAVSDKCKFHDLNYSILNTGEIHNLLNEKIMDSLQYGTPLLIIGYHISSLDLSEKKFLSTVIFSETTFHDDVIFDFTEFLNYVDFSKCKFYGGASFFNSVFQKNANFNEITILGESQFTHCHFYNDSDFSNSNFQKNSFAHTIFNYVDFSGTVFSEFSNFNNVVFNSKVDFIETYFNEGVNLNYSKFIAEASFSKTKFLKKSLLRNVQFQSPKSVFIDGDLSNLSMINSDIMRIKFGNDVVWNVEDRNPFCKWLYFKNKNRDYQIFDERLLENNLEVTINLESILDVYRNLRENFDYYLKYDNSGEFFVREMELKRKYRINPKNIGRKTIPKQYFSQRLSLLSLYNVIGQYGNSIYRPFYFSIAIISFFTLYFLTNQLTNLPKLFESNFLYNVGDSFIRSLAGFVPFDVPGSNVPSAADIVLRIILLPISGAFFVSIKRKLERTFRH